MHFGTTELTYFLWLSVMVCFPHQHVGTPEDVGFFSAWFLVVFPRIQGSPVQHSCCRDVQGMLNERMLPGKPEAHQACPLRHDWAPGPARDQFCLFWLRQFTSVLCGSGISFSELRVFSVPVSCAGGVNGGCWAAAGSPPGAPAQASLLPGTP